MLCPSDVCLLAFTRFTFITQSNDLHALLSDLIVTMPQLSLSTSHSTQSLPTCRLPNHGMPLAVCRTRRITDHWTVETPSRGADLRTSDRLHMRTLIHLAVLLGRGPPVDRGLENGSQAGGQGSALLVRWVLTQILMFSMDCFYFLMEFLEGANAVCVDLTCLRNALRSKCRELIRK